MYELGMFVVVVALYVFFCYCLKVICEKCGEDPGVLVWIPIAQLIPVLKIAKFPVWVILLFFIPIVNIVVTLIVWSRIAQARGKSPLLVIMLLIPIVNIAFFPYLAFPD